jgi:adenylate cyclase
LPPDSRFCNKCGTPITPAATSAEFKQVTVLFADVVHSMDLAAAVGAERLREIMSELFDRSTAAVTRYGGSVNQFTGDGIMAVFGAPIALEDHATRACLTALEIQKRTKVLAAQVNRLDGVTLQLRIGLNSGEVIAGEIGSSTASYTAIGEQVGMAQRMESVAPPGGVMLSESTARLVENTVELGEADLVHIKGIDAPVRASRLLAAGQHPPRRHSESTLVGRAWELNTITAILDEVIDGAGCVVNIVGPAGIGKSRLVREAGAVAVGRGVVVLTAYCESHASDIPFHVVAPLLRAAMRIDDLDANAARARVRDRLPGADHDDLLLLDDLLGIRDAATALPNIAPDARRRRVTALVNAAALAGQEPGIYVIEDAHWIDEASESMLADFLAVIPQTPSLVLITYRPEYHGSLSRLPDAQTLALRPLSDAHATVLTAELLGADPSLAELAGQVAARAAGNPFFAEEMVRDLAERGVLRGQPGAYRLRGDVAAVDVPATLQATIGARIDRLGPAAKHTLNAAAVIGSRFDADLLSSLLDSPDVTPLIDAQLVDQVRFTRRGEYAFRHPLIRAVAYESQLKSDRAQLHRRLALAIENRDPGSADENAALVAEHLEAAGDLHAAFTWHMRAATWSTNRDIAAAHTSWRRARQVADRLPEDDPDRMWMRIAPRSLLCGLAFRVGSGRVDPGFDELRELCTAAGDQRSLAIGMAGLVTALNASAHCREASRLATELVGLLESIGDPALTVALSFAAMNTKQDTGEVAEVLRLAERVIDLAEGDTTKGNLIFASPVISAIAIRGVARLCLGVPGWRNDLDQALATARMREPVHGVGPPGSRLGVIWFNYGAAVGYGALLPDATALRETAEILAMAEQWGDDLGLAIARTTRGISLIHQDGPQREAGLNLLAEVGEAHFQERFAKPAIVSVANIHIAHEKARLGDLGRTVELARIVVDDLFASGGVTWSAPATAVLVEALLRRGGDTDLQDAQAAIDRLAVVPTDPGFVMHEIWLLRLRALLARAHGDAPAYAHFRDRYREMATELGFEGHMAWAEAMP